MNIATLEDNESFAPLVRVGDIVDRLTNGYVGATRDIYQEEGVPYLLAKHVKRNRVQFDNKTYVTTEFNEKHSKSILKTGDVLLVQSGHIGETAVVPSEHDGHNCHAMIVITPTAGMLDGKYLSYYWHTPRGRAELGRIETGATLKHLNCRDVINLKIPLPPLSEQKRIAGILDKADSIRRKASLKTSFSRIPRSTVRGAICTMTWGKSTHVKD